MDSDPIHSDPSLYSVAFENDRVRVLRYHDHPGDHTHPHSHPDSVMITLSGFDRRLIHGDQEVNVTLPSGEVRWLDAQTHSGANIGSTDTVTIFVELKEPGPAAGSGQLGPRT
ncbi:MAG: cytoplasmic protein [bacterium]|nr:cytoplasmic protein [bacterium]